MRRVLCAVSVAFLSLGAADALALPSGFTKTRAVSGLVHPTSMAFAPDGRLFVTERGTPNSSTAKVRVIKNGSLLSTPFVSITVDNTTVSPNERGLLGLAFDPSFSSNHFIYVYYTVPGSTPHNRISRFTANGDVAVSGSEKVLLELNGLSAGVHNGGALHFGNDGKLYVGVGENHNAANSTNLGNYLGKILRINADGSAPSDNPFFNSGDGIGAKDRIWAYGMRNPFTFAVQPGTGRIFVNDVGEATWEEIDDLVKGKDYGWRGGSTDGDSTAWFKYDHNAGKTICGGAFYNPPSAPGSFGSFVGRYFFGDYVNGWIKSINTSTKSVSTFETGLAGPVDIDVASDGSLYYLSYTNGEVWKVTSTSGATQGIVLSTTEFNINEGGSGSFTVKLATQPSANVTVNVARSSGDTGITPSVSSLTFTTSNWSTAQTVRVSAADDSDTLNESAVISCSASGLSTQKVVVNAFDNDYTGPKTLISLPKQGDIVKGTGAEYFGGSDQDATSTKGQFFIDGVLKYTDSGAGHYHFGGSHAVWDTTTLKEGTHTLKLTVFDSSNRPGSHQITVTVDNLPTPWNHQDVGAVSGAGSATQASGTFKVNGAGADIWGSADEFQFVYKKLSGDGEVKARVASIENTNTWAKAGVMIRETLTAGSKHAFMTASAGGALAFQRRTATGGTSSSTDGGTDAPPAWVRIKRAGSTLTGFKSADGSTWTTVGTASISMATDVFIGLAVTSHLDGTLCTASFDNVSTSGTTSFAALVMADASEEPSGLEPGADDPTDPEDPDPVAEDRPTGGCGGEDGRGAAGSVLLVSLALRARRRRRK